MITEKMNVHKALSELKILNDRITKQIHVVEFCVSNKVSNEKINGMSVENWKKDVQAKWESINALINRRNAIKRAVSLSNAKTEVTVADKNYTVAEAIEMKQYGMTYYRELLRKLQFDFSEANESVERINSDADFRATDYAQKCVGTDKNSVEAMKEVEQIRMSYYNSHKAELINPIDITNKIEELENKIAQFTTEIDSVLSVSNATTIITIEYEN
jgi:predicted RNA-binding Zn ribbon-like protein